MTHLLCHPAASANALGLLLNKVSLTMLDCVDVVFFIRVTLNDEILPTIKKLLSSIANSPLKCQGNDMALGRGSNLAPQE